MSDQPHHVQIAQAQVAAAYELRYDDDLRDIHRTVYSRKYQRQGVTAMNLVGLAEARQFQFDMNELENVCSVVGHRFHQDLPDFCAQCFEFSTA